MHTDAIVAVRAGRLHRTAVELPEPGPADAVVRVRYGGICGSDLHYWRDGRVGEYVLREPLVLGHEIVGTVERAAADGSGPRPGTPVAVRPASVCGTCPACLSGRVNLCEDLRYLGSAARFPHTPGGFADRMVVPSGRLLDVSGVPLRRAALVEPASVAWHAVGRAARTADLTSDVAVVGAGPIGLLCVAVLRARYPGAHVTATDLHPAPLDRARALGADDVAVGAADEEAFDVVLETSGSVPGFTAAVRAARRGGCVVAVGQLPERVTAPFPLVVGRELDVVGSSRFAREDEDVVAALRAGTLDVEAVVSHVLPARDALAAFALAADAAASSKVLLDFGDDAPAGVVS